MDPTTDLLRGELERLFDLEEMKKLSADLLAMDPESVGGTAGKGAFARSLVERCVSENALEALADAMLLSPKGRDAKVQRVFEASGEVELAPGTRVGEFKISKKIGEGGLGVVYLAERKDDFATTKAALKVLRGEHARDRAAVKRFLAVQRALCGVREDGIADVLGAGELPDGRPWVATEFVDGQVLSARIARVGPMHFNEARPILARVLGALDALHARGFVHGDVKAENLFIVRPPAEAGVVKEPLGVFVDAGSDRLFARPRSKAVVRAERAITSVGTSAKASAPELLRGGAPDLRSDLYAFGCLLFELLTGKRVFPGDNAADVAMQHLTIQPPAPSVVAPRGWVVRELDEIVLKCLAKDPDARWASGTALRDALEYAGRGARPSTAPAAKKELDAEAFDAAYEDLLLDAGNAERAATLEALVAEAGAWDRAVEVFGSCAAETDDVEAKKALLFRVARIQETELNHPNAAEAAYQSVLEFDPSNEIALNGIEELRRASDDHEGLVELLLEKVEKAEFASDRAEILHEIATIYEEQLGQPDSAFVAWIQALAEHPDDRAARAIERLAGEDGARWSEALTTLGEHAKEVDDVTTKVALYVQMGTWYDAHLGRPDFAAPCFSQALGLDPANEDALDGTISLYERAQAWPDLIAVLLRRADVSPSATTAREIRVYAAEIALEKIGDTERAVEIFRQILADEPSHAAANEILGNIWAEQGRWDELTTLFERKAHDERGEEKSATLCALAELYEDRLQNADKAQSAYESALTHEPRNLAALRGLERLYTKAGKHAELLANLRVQIELTATPRQKIALLTRIAALLEEEFVDGEKAMHAYEEVVSIDPGHEVANAALERLYRQLHRFDALADAYERHGKSATDEQRKVDLFLQAAKVLLVDVGAFERALKLTERVLAIQPGHAETLEIVARLRAKSGDAHAAIEATEQLANAEKDPEKKSALLARAGKIAEEKGDLDLAIQKYKLAIDSFPTSKDARTALRAIYVRRGDAQGESELLQREITWAEAPRDRAKLLSDLAGLRRDRLQDRAGARATFKEALAADPSCAMALFGVGVLAFEERDYETAGKQLEPLLSRSGELTGEAARALGVLCGDALSAIGAHDKAKRAYVHAKGFTPSDRELLHKIADATFAEENWDEAASLYRAFLADFGAQLTAPEKGKLTVRLGDTLRRAGDHNEAIRVLNDAKALLPRDDGSALDVLGAIYEAREQWKDAIETYKKRVDIAEDDGEKYEIHVKIGDLLLDKTKDKEGASKAYVAALGIRGDDRNLLTKLMAVYSESKDWGRLVEILMRIADLVTEPKQLAKYLITAAGICQRELSRYDDAAEYYERALAHDPSLEKAHEGLLTCLAKKEDWVRLEQALRNHVDRIEPSATPEDKAHAWDRLGELLRDKLKRDAEAIDALEHAQRLDPENRARTERLAELYAKDPKRWFHKAVRTHADLLDKNPYRVESYQALRELYTQMKRPDESWCVCQVLRVMQMARPDEDAFFRKHRSDTPAAAQERFDESFWADHVVHPEQDPLLTLIFATVTPAILATRSQPLSAAGIDPAKRRDPETDDAVISQTLYYAAGVLDLELPEVYLRDADPGGLSFLFTNPPAIGVGRAALAGGPPQALAFVAGRHLSYLRPGHFVRHLVPTGAGLRAWLLAAIRFTQPGFPLPADQSALVTEHLTAIRAHVSPPAQEHLRSLVQKLLASAPELNLKRWVAAVDMTADRVGFVLANDLELSLAVVRASPEEMAAVGHKDRLKDLHTYASGEAYLALRHKLGVTIGG